MLRCFKDYFGCGQFYLLDDGVQRRGDFVVSKLSDIRTKIIPFFLDYPIIGVKARDFQSWCEVSELMFKKEHLNTEGLDKIRKIKDSINKTLNPRK